MKRFLIGMLCLVCVMAVAGPASAAVNLTIGDLLGVAVPGTPASEAEELLRLNFAIDLYNASLLSGTDGEHDYLIAPNGGWGANLPSRPIADATGGFAVQVADVSDFNITGYTWILIKLGQDEAYYYLDGQSGTLDSYFDPFPVSDAGKGGSLSHITLFGPGTTRVPEAGALLMFGSGLIGLVGYRRLRRMQ